MTQALKKKGGGFSFVHIASYVVARCFSYGGLDYGMDKCKSSHTPQTKVEMRKRAPFYQMSLPRRFGSQVIETAIT